MFESTYIFIVFPPKKKLKLYSFYKRTKKANELATFNYFPSFPTFINFLLIYHQCFTEKKVILLFCYILSLSTQEPDCCHSRVQEAENARTAFHNNSLAGKPEQTKKGEN